jgi:voltage-gated potassium channel
MKLFEEIKNHKIYKDFINLPWLSVTQQKNQNKIKTAILDILDGTFWTSKASIIGNFFIILVILLSTLLYIIGTDLNHDDKDHIYVLLSTITGFFITIEVSLRLFYVGELGYKGKLPIISYITSFYGIIDLLTITPIILGLAGIATPEPIKICCIFRLWRITRYIPAFNNIKVAFNSRKGEIIISLVAILMLSLTLSAFIFHFEKDGNSHKYSGVSEVFVWSIGKYTGDYGDIASFAPASKWGKFFATINGLLGIAIFALPAGLLASAFIDEIGQRKKNKIIEQRANKIVSILDRIGGSPEFTKQYPNVKHRYISLDKLQSKLQCSDQEIFEAVRHSPHLRFRAVKSSPELRFTDIRIVEHFSKNKKYGHAINVAESNILIINPSGASDEGISHLASTVANQFKFNIISKEVDFNTDKNEIIGSNKSKNYMIFFKAEKAVKHAELSDFLADIKEMAEDKIVIILSTAASGREELNLEYFVKKEQDTGSSQSKIFDIINIIEKHSIIKTTLKSHSHNAIYREGFTLSKNSMGLTEEQNSLLKNIHDKANKNIIAIHLNKNLLIANSDEYYCMLLGILNMFKEIKEVCD